MHAEQVLARSCPFPSEWDVENHVGIKKQPHRLLHVLGNDVLKASVAVRSRHRKLPGPPLRKLAGQLGRATLCRRPVYCDRDDIIVDLIDDERVAWPEAERFEWGRCRETRWSGHAAIPYVARY